MRRYFVYMMANAGRMLYTGITNDLERRVFQHKRKLGKGYVSKYDITRLVYYEWTPNVLAAIAREKQIKGWLRKKKIALIESVNPSWRDLSDDWNHSHDSFHSARDASSPAARNDTRAEPSVVRGGRWQRQPCRES